MSDKPFLPPDSSHSACQLKSPPAARSKEKINLSLLPPDSSHSACQLKSPPARSKESLKLSFLPPDSSHSACQLKSPPARSKEKINLSLLPPEIEEGNIEYKRHLLKSELNEKRILKYASQLQWRMNEGNGEAVYYIGIDDDGSVYGLSKSQIRESMKTFKEMCKDVNAKIIKVEYPCEGAVKITVRSKKNVIRVKEHRTVFLGNTGVGKSSLISLICYGLLDDGNGSSRQALFKHKHEFDSGKTSSFSSEIIGFQGDKVINYSKTKMTNNLESNLYGQGYICQNSDRIVSLIDLPGASNYDKTVFYYLMSTFANNIVLVVDPIQQLDDRFLDFLQFALFLEIPVSIVVTKTDLDLDLDLDKVKSDNIPVFPISNVTGEGITEFQEYLGHVSKTRKEIKDKTEFQINHTLSLPELGTIISGLTTHGQIQVNKEYLLGPIFENGSEMYKKVEVHSIHYKQMPVDELITGQTGSIVLKPNSDVKKGMFLTDIFPCPTFREAEVEITLLKHPTQMNTMCEIQFFTKNMYQIATVLEIEDEPIMPGEKSVAQIQFKNFPLPIKQDDKFIFRAGKNIVGYGTVLTLI